MLKSRRSRRSYSLAQFMYRLESFQQNTRGPGIFLLLQICHTVAFILVKGSHLLVYSILLTYCPNNSRFTHLPLLFMVVTTICAFSENKILYHISTRAFQVFSASSLAYVSLLTGNLIGILAAIAIFLGFLFSHTPHGTTELDQIYRFLWDVNIAVVMSSAAVIHMINSGIVIRQFYFFSTELGKECALLKTKDLEKSHTSTALFGLCQVES
ncbi:unnamed protein product [Allacma fusca]|uniref:Uncharacterized protein n=1 Tax=Allacma fusca TaxID=39272 RepID=A0A8J2P6N0_9HEXA|nr:unnamed protein product [Allacma fusca]